MHGENLHDVGKLCFLTCTKSDFIFSLHLLNTTFKWIAFVAALLISESYIQGFLEMLMVF